MAKSHSLRWPLILLAGLFILSSLIFWPGILSSDSIIQHQDARAQVYSDHNPPAMTFVWHYLDLIYPGPALMLMLHLTMLYAAMTIFIIIFKDSRFKWWFVVFPLIPSILSYTPLIVKDVGFTYAYLLAGATLAYLMMHKINKHKYPILLFVLLLLFYGTAVKYQGRFLLIFLTLGVGFCLDYKFNKRALISGLGLYGAILLAMFSFNGYLVTNKNEAHSWQLVKFYDLSAISIYLDKPLYPEFVQANPNFNFTRIKNEFSQSEVDPLVFGGSTTLLKSGRTPEQRAELLQYWRTVVTAHPFLYLKSRFLLWKNNFFSVPSDRSNPAQFLKSTRLSPIVSQPLIYAGINTTYKAVNFVLQFVWLLPLLVLYTYLSVVNLKKSLAAAPLLMFCATTIGMLAILFFFSMAATARYIFVCTCLVHISHAFAYRCWRDSY